MATAPQFASSHLSQVPAQHQTTGDASTIGQRRIVRSPSADLCRRIFSVALKTLACLSAAFVAAGVIGLIAGASLFQLSLGVYSAVGITKVADPILCFGVPSAFVIGGGIGMGVSLGLADCVYPRA